MARITAFFVFFFLSLAVNGQELRLAVLKYSGGGDWYANPSSLTNLIAFCNKEINTNLHPEYDVVEPGSRQLFLYPFVHMTGHGNVVFSGKEVENIRNYLLSGGFLHIDDNYGMDPYIRPEIKKLFPDLELTELGPDHPIFKKPYVFPNGLPKIHEHDNQPPQAFALFHENRMILLYTHETDLGNGWEDQEVHNNPEEVRRKALQMGANIIQYVFRGALP